MAKVVLENFDEFPVLPEGSIIHTRVEDVVEREVNGKNGTWKKLEFTFKITDIQTTGDGSPTEKYESLVGSKIWGSCPFRFVNSPDNRLKQFVEAILGMTVDVGFELDTDLLVGKKVRAITNQYDKKTINSATGKPFKGQQVDALLPMGTATVGSPAQAPKTVWDDEDIPF